MALAEPSTWQNRITRYGEEAPDQLLAHPLNFRTHPKHQQDALSGVLGDVGVVQNVIVNERTGHVVDGHLRLTLALRQNQPTIPVTYVDLSPEEEALILATLDPISALAGADRDKLDQLLRDVSTDDAAVMQMLSDLAEDAGVIGFGGTDGLTDPDDVPDPPTEPITQPGDLWLLGRHRLLCGDSTKASSYSDPVDMVMTSPPYWVGKEYETQKTWPEVQDFITQFCDALITNVKQAARVVINTGTTPASSLTGERAHIRLLIDDYQRELARHGWLMRYVRIWAKRGQLGLIAPSMDVVDQHWEFIAVFYHPKGYQGQRRVGEPWATDGIWDMHGEMSSHGHVAAYPVEIPERNIRLYTDEGATVLDPFLGSGTTLIACERTGRNCIGIDNSPTYVDMAVQRWEAFTGQTAERATDAIAAD